MKPTFHIVLDEEGFKQLWVEDDCAFLFENQELNDPDSFVFEGEPPTLRTHMEEGKIKFEWRPILNSRLKMSTDKVSSPPIQQDKPTAQSAFLLWFRAQHGPRPGGAVSDDNLADLVRQGETARAVLQLRSAYDRQEQSALYAWQVKDDQKTLAYVNYNIVRRPKKENPDETNRIS